MDTFTPGGMNGSQASSRSEEKGHASRESSALTLKVEVPLDTMIWLVTYGNGPLMPGHKRPTPPPTRSGAEPGRPAASIAEAIIETPTRPKIAFEKIEGSVQDFKSGFVVWVIAAARKREQDQQTSRFCASAETWRFEDCRQLGERSANCETLRRWL